MNASTDALHILWNSRQSYEIAKQLGKVPCQLLKQMIRYIFRNEKNDVTDITELTAVNAFA